MLPHQLTTSELINVQSNDPLVIELQSRLFNKQDLANDLVKTLDNTSYDCNVEKLLHELVQDIDRQPDDLSAQDTIKFLGHCMAVIQEVLQEFKDYEADIKAGDVDAYNLAEQIQET